MSDPRYLTSTERLPPDLEAKARALVLKDTWTRAARQIGTVDTTLHKLLEGPGLTRRARDRIAEKLRALPMASVNVATFESAEGQARGLFLHVEASGEGTGELIGAALAMAGRLAR